MPSSSDSDRNSSSSGARPSRLRQRSIIKAVLVGFLLVSILVCGVELIFVFWHTAPKTSRAFYDLAPEGLRSSYESNFCGLASYGFAPPPKPGYSQGVDHESSGQPGVPHDDEIIGGPKHKPDEAFGRGIPGSLPFGFIQNSGAPRKLINESAKYLGTPYGIGPGKMNCSEFTATVYRRAIGVSMPSDVSTQLNYGYAPRRKKPGDLLFFNEYGNGVSHVAIYLKPGWCRHASTYTGQVSDTKINYIDGYFAVRRIRK
jgi:hypothetical protein